MKIQDLVQLYAKSPKVAALDKTVKNVKERHIYL